MSLHPRKFRVVVAFLLTAAFISLTWLGQGRGQAPRLPPRNPTWYWLAALALVLLAALGGLVWQRRRGMT